MVGCETLNVNEKLNLPKPKMCVKGDCKDGYGTFISKKQKYIGYFIDRKANGQGTLTLPDGRVLKGYFKNNMLN